MKFIVNILSKKMQIVHTSLKFQLKQCFYCSSHPLVQFNNDKTLTRSCIELNKLLVFFDGILKHDISFLQSLCAYL